MPPTRLHTADRHAVASQAAAIWPAPWAALVAHTAGAGGLFVNAIHEFVSMTQPDAQLPFATHPALRLLVTITIEVLLMTYWLMPLITRRLAGWIYPRRRVA